jgi:uncharacterized protein (TIGR03067 family)
MLTEPREALIRSSTFKLTTSGWPGRIDLQTVYQDGLNPVHTTGIYSLQDDVLTYCIAAPGGLKPTKFATEKGDGYTLVVLRRIRAQNG